jgi:hypothetical protein
MQMEVASSATIAFNPSMTNVSAGGSFTVDIFGSSVNSIGGFSLFLNSSANGNQIQITSQILNTTDFSYGGPGPSFPESISATQNSQDLGAFSNVPLASNTQYLLGTDTIFINSATPAGLYTISNTAGTVFTDPTFTMSDFASISNFSINVQAVPEPSTWAFLLVASAFLAAGLVIGKRSQHGLVCSG